VASSVDRRRPLIVLLAAWALLAVAFGVWDLPITRWAADPACPWGAFVERWGELPGLLLVVWALLLLAAGRLTAPGGVKDGAVGGLYTLLAMMALTYGGTLVARNLGMRADPLASRTWMVWLGSGLAALAAVTALYRAGGPADRRLLWVARTTFRLALWNWLLFVQPVKLLWGRVRFHDLVAPDFAAFTPWYLPQGITGHTSFPSGHAAMGWMLLPLLLLVSRSSRSIRTLTWVIVLGWGIFVAAARVRYGAHFPSDVLFPTALAAVIMLSGGRRPPGPADTG